MRLCLRDPWVVGTNDNPLCRHGGQDRSSLSLLSITSIAISRTCQ